MQEEERRLKIVAKQSYERELSDAERSIVDKKVSLGISTICFLLNTTAFILNIFSGNVLLAASNFSLGVINGTNAKQKLDKYIEALKKITDLKENISQVERELNDWENDENMVKSYADAYALYASQHEKYDIPTIEVPSINIPNSEKDYSSSYVPTLEFPTEEKTRGRM